MSETNSAAETSGSNESAETPDVETLQQSVKFQASVRKAFADYQTAVQTVINVKHKAVKQEIDQEKIVNKTIINTISPILAEQNNIPVETIMKVIAEIKQEIPPLLTQAIQLPELTTRIESALTDKLKTTKIIDDTQKAEVINKVKEIINNNLSPPKADSGSQQQAPTPDGQ